MKPYAQSLVAASLVACIASTTGCGSDSSPTGASPASPATSASAPGFSTAGRSAELGTPTQTVAAILTMPANFVGQMVELSGQLAQPLDARSFLFTDGTGAIPADFPTDTLPPLNQTILIAGTIVPGTGDFAARITVTSWQQPAAFACEDMEDVRARFSDPGFIAGNVVGLYLGYRGVPAGNKTLEVVWDEGNPSGLVERFEIGEGRPRGDGLFDLEGVVGHEYPGVNAAQTKNVRATLMIVGRDGQCSRVRDAMVSKGDGPGFAAGGALALRLNDPVPSGGFFSVTARVTNPSSVAIEFQLFFSAPDGSSIRSFGDGCTQLPNQEAKCVIEGIAGGKFGETFVQYNVPVVTKPTSISGSVTLVGRDFSPVASYSTTVEP